MHGVVPPPVPAGRHTNLHRTYNLRRLLCVPALISDAQIRSRDIHGSYICFSLSSRVPAFCTLVSSASLMVFLGLVACDAWPKGILALGILVVFVMCLQSLVYAAHCCAAHVTMAVHASQEFLGTAGAVENV